MTLSIAALGIPAHPLMTNLTLDKRAAGALLKKRREERGLTQEQVVDNTTVPTGSYLSNLEAGNVNPARSKHFQSLATYLRLSQEDIRAILPSAVFDVIQSPPVSRRSSELSSEHDLVIMPVYGLCEAGKPVAEMEEDPEVSPIGLPRRRWRPGALVFRVQGESMQREDERGISPDDLVVVDTRMLDLIDGKVYVIHIPGSGVTLKRVRFLGGQAWLFSDNPNQQEFPPFQVDDARILGRVYSKISVEVM